MPLTRHQNCTLHVFHLSVKFGDSELTGELVLQDDVFFGPSTQQKFDLFNKTPSLYEKWS